MSLVSTDKFPKSVRLRRRAEFLQLSSSLHKSSVHGFLLVWRVNNLQTARLGITASKKVGCAVVRNRIKRCLREVFRCNRLQILPVDLNIIARRESAQMTFHDIERVIKKAFQTVGLSSCSRAFCSS